MPILRLTTCIAVELRERLPATDQGRVRIDCGLKRDTGFLMMSQRDLSVADFLVRSTECRFDLKNLVDRAEGRSPLPL